MIWSAPVLKDTTIYEFDPYRNTGLDPILELYKKGDISTDDLNESRILIQFDLSELSHILTENSVTIDDVVANLNLYAVLESELPTQYSIEAKAIATPWFNGIGYKSYPSSVSTTTLENGATWVDVNGSGSLKWTDVSTSGTTSSYSNELGGGVWYTGSITSQSFSFKSTDSVNIDVTNVVKSWYNGDFDNNGLLISFKYSEISSSNYPNTILQFYSAETHTVYEPQLYIQWSGSQSYSTGSYSVATIDDNPIIFTKSFKSEQLQNKKIRIQLGTRPKFPRKSFVQNSVFSSLKALPRNSFYQIKDAHTNQILIPYSDFTKINTVNDLSYFDVYTTMLYPERFYKFEIKVDFNDITEYYHGDDFIFKVIS